MKFNPINCWLLSSEILNLDSLEFDKVDLKIIKKSILKNGYRAFLLEDTETTKKKSWYSDFLIGHEVRVYIEGSGIYKVANIDLSDNEIYFEKINIPIGYKPWLFFSWQSDYNCSRSIIKDVLDEICEDINANFSPKQPIEIVAPMRDEDGSDNILLSLKKNIDLSLMFIADVSNVGQVISKSDEGKDTTSKSIPNPNVVFELSYSYLRKRQDQIILLKRKRSDFVPDDLPFDFAQNRIISFTSKSTLKTALDKSIKGYLQRINFIIQP